MTDLSCPTPESRRARIVATAREAFLSCGYAGTSMSRIAAAVGGSKTTLWSYFPSKEDLFIAVIEGFAEEHIEPVEAILSIEGDLVDMLKRFGLTILEATLAPTTVALVRVVTAEAGRFPELGRMFHEQAIGRGWQQVATFIHGARDAGLLDPQCDPMIAARHFVALCQANSYQMVMLGGAPVPDRAMIVEDAECAASTFLRAYGVRESAI